MTQKLFAYIRVSTEDQARKGTEVNQVNTINRYLEAHPEYMVVHWFKDLAMSGARQDRPQYLELLGRLAEVDGLIVFDISRTARDSEVWTFLMYSLRNTSKFLIKAKDGSLSDYNADDTKLLTDYVEGWTAEKELKNTKARITEGIRTYRGRHGRWGRREPVIDWKAVDGYRSRFTPPMPYSLVVQMPDISYDVDANGNRLPRDGSRARTFKGVRKPILGVSRAYFNKKLKERKNV